MLKQSQKSPQTMPPVAKKKKVDISIQSKTTNADFKRVSYPEKTRRIRSDISGEIRDKDTLNSDFSVEIL